MTGNSAGRPPRGPSRPMRANGVAGGSRDEAERTHHLGGLAWVGPLLVAAVLVLPGIRLGYAWDDYHFLANAQNRRLTDLLPDPGDMFYRPISRGVYFLALETLGHGAAQAGHLLNLLILCAGVALMARVGSRLGGARMGLYSSLAFATLSSVPLLVDWASGVQDLLAVLFLLAALEYRLAGRNLAAFWMAACGILSKETVMSLVPVLVLLDWILGRRPYRAGRESAGRGSSASTYSRS